ncbi:MULTISPECIES: hypothetical protein [unclassified Coleofasciculus]|nr:MULTISPECIES: hypothetical protein [unclassified Coleofasciculus]MBE9125090.1 hypothetical protein [Coleofasciculus sp. LEGE 07081]MBE9150093.1 hypothetical protein [Coleofasciculus sp. LEGE 07092]
MSLSFAVVRGFEQVSMPDRDSGEFRRVTNAAAPGIYQRTTQKFERSPH